MKAIILAAGMNSRLKNAIDVPKCLLHFGNQTLLERQIEELMKVGFLKNDIFVVVGYKHDMIRKVHDNVIMNYYYDKYDNAYSAYIALDYLFNSVIEEDEDIYIFDGDLIYDTRLIQQIMSYKKPNVLVNREIPYSTSLKDEISIINQDNKIEKIQIPSTSNPLDSDFFGKKLFSYCGIAKLSSYVARDLLARLKGKIQGWYTVPLVESVNVNDFYSFAIPKSLKFYFDVDTMEDFQKLKIISSFGDKDGTE